MARPLPLPLLLRREGRLSPRGCLVVVGVAVIVAVTLLVFAYRRASTPPAVWGRVQQRMQAMGGAQRAAVADHFYKSLVAELSSIRDDAPDSANPAAAHAGNTPSTRTITLSIDAVDAWLRERLGDLLANQGVQLPPGVNRPMVAVDDGHLVAAFRTEPPGRGEGKVVSLTFDPRITPAGKAELALRSVRIGRLTVPRSLALAQIRSPRPDRRVQEAIGRLTAVLEGAEFDPAFPIDPSRQVRVLAIRLAPRAVELTIRTEPRGGLGG